MAGDWYGELSPADRAEWDAYEKRAREHTVRGMAGSAFVMSLVPDGEPDIKFATELGLAIMLDKPLLAVVMPGRKVPSGLRRVAREIVEADVDTEAGRARLARRIKIFQERL
jgi:hypothetical protein